MEQQGPQTHFFLGHIGDIRTVQATAQADDAVEILALAFSAYVVGQLHQLDLAAGIRVPIWCNGGREIVAVIALTLDVEPNIRIGRVHYAVAADFISSALEAGHLVNECCELIIAQCEFLEAQRRTLDEVPGCDCKSKADERCGCH